MKKSLFIFVMLLIFVFPFTLTAFAEDPEEVSYGAEYSLVTPASEGYPDDGVKLTDGIYGTIPEGSENYYSSGAYVGFNRSNVDGNGNFVIILDLGKSYGNLSRFTIGFLNETSAGISAPKSVTFAISNERNGEYTDLGTLTTRQDYTEVPNTLARTLEVSNAAGRYVKITVTPDEYSENDTETQIAAWTFIDEIAVHGSTVSNGTSEIESSDIDTPQTGDMSSKTVGYALLAVSAVSMALALFLVIKRRWVNNSEF